MGLLKATLIKAYSFTVQSVSGKALAAGESCVKLPQSSPTASAMSLTHAFVERVEFGNERHCGFLNHSVSVFCRFTTGFEVKKRYKKIENRLGRINKK